MDDYFECKLIRSFGFIGGDIVGKRKKKWEVVLVRKHLIREVFI